MFTAPHAVTEDQSRSGSSGHLASDLQRQGDFFVADILEFAPKDDIASMEHPLFALKAGDRRIRVYERNGLSVTVKPSVHGCATIHDKDLWIYCISQLVEAKNRGRPIDCRVRFTGYDFLRNTNRSTSGVGYGRMIDMLRRLRGTSVETNIATAQRHERREFGLLESWRIVEDAPGGGRATGIEVELPQWLFRSVEALHVLTLSREYFRLRKPLDRRIYELARKHCGVQPKWRVSIAVLHRKSGSTSTLREFRRQIKALAASGALPDYMMAIDPERDGVTFYVGGPKGYLAEARDMLAGRPHAPLIAHEKVHARKLGRRRAVDK